MEFSPQGKPWQNTLSGSKSKLSALFHNGYISDLTITFPGKEISYKAHKVILAMASPVFEQMLFGPMAISGSCLELQDDYPEAFKIVLAHCYDVTLAPADIDEAMAVYMLADKYLLEDLKRKCSCWICSMVDSDIIEKVLEFSMSFNFSSLKESCYEHITNNLPDLLLFLSEEWINDLLKADITPQILEFDESWQNPDEILKENSLMKIVKSRNCSSPGLWKFSGCVSAKVVREIQWDETPELYVSFINFVHANEVLSVLGDIEYDGLLSIHLQCKVIPADKLNEMPELPYMPVLFLSNVDDNGIDWVVTVVKSLKPFNDTINAIKFPRSTLSLSGFKILLERIAIVFADVKYPDLSICSSNIPSDKKHELDAWIVCNIEHDDHFICPDLLDVDEDLMGW